MLVTLEGIDGSGKTTVWEALQDSRPAATFTQEPTETWYGEAVRRSLRDDDADPLAELFLYTADHAAHLARTVRPVLGRGGGGGTLWFPTEIQIRTQEMPSSFSGSK